MTELIQIPYALVGNGRLGKRILTTLTSELAKSELTSSKQAEFQSSEIPASKQLFSERLSLKLTPQKDRTDTITQLRLDPKRGLLLKKDSPHHIKHLIICISPTIKNQQASASATKHQPNLELETESKPKTKPNPQTKWHWSEIFRGLIDQTNSGSLVIDNVIFISSTRVFDGIKTGRIDANAIPRAKSERGRALIQAERDLCNIASTCQILRCSGLYGGDYQKYQQILSKPSQMPRFGVEVDKVVNTVISLATTSSAQNQYHLLTDGYCYIDGKKTNAAKAFNENKCSRVLISSCTNFRQ